MAGSSPHTRGTIPACPENFGHLRFIPAYAGNDSCAPSSVNAITVHPRIRGERALRGVLHRGESGSSPHTRGTHRRADRIAQHHRFIPAYAGNAASRCEMPATSSVHPRIRGERNNEIARVAPSIGSSPHTRGTPVRDDARVHIDRFIPAYAGNAVIVTTVQSPLSVHPRIRGERSPNTIVTTQGDGSSPHTRGTRQQG